MLSIFDKTFSEITVGEAIAVYGKIVIIAIGVLVGLYIVAIALIVLRRKIKDKRNRYDKR